jgi:hypothetical protein
MEHGWDNSGNHRESPGDIEPRLNGCLTGHSVRWTCAFGQTNLSEGAGRQGRAADPNPSNDWADILIRQLSHSATVWDMMNRSSIDERVAWRCTIMRKFCKVSCCHDSTLILRTSAEARWRFWGHVHPAAEEIRLTDGPPVAWIGLWWSKRRFGTDVVTQGVPDSNELTFRAAANERQNKQWGQPSIRKLMTIARR